VSLNTLKGPEKLIKQGRPSQQLCQLTVCIQLPISFHSLVVVYFFLHHFQGIVISLACVTASP